LATAIRAASKRFSRQTRQQNMRAEIQNVVDDIKQSLALLRRHL